MSKIKLSEMSIQDKNFAVAKTLYSQAKITKDSVTKGVLVGEIPFDFCLNIGDAMSLAFENDIQYRISRGKLIWHKTTRDLGVYESLPKSKTDAGEGVAEAFLLIHGWDY